MKSLIIVPQLFSLLLLMVGCEAQVPSNADSDSSGFRIHSKYAPAKIDIMPLTELVSAGSDTEEVSEIRVYVSLLDAFDCQVKMPGVFRFELYEKVVRTADPKGSRIKKWPDFELTSPQENNRYWQDFLRAYAFDLPFEPEANKSYILQATCISPAGKRLSAEFELPRRR